MFWVGPDWWKRASQGWELAFCFNSKPTQFLRYQTLGMLPPFHLCWVNYFKKSTTQFLHLSYFLGFVSFAKATFWGLKWGHLQGNISEPPGKACDLWSQWSPWQPTSLVAFDHCVPFSQELMAALQQKTSIFNFAIGIALNMSNAQTHCLETCWTVQVLRL